MMAQKRHVAGRLNPVRFPAHGQQPVEQFAVSTPDVQDSAPPRGCGDGQVRSEAFKQSVRCPASRVDLARLPFREPLQAVRGDPLCPLLPPRRPRAIRGVELAQFIPRGRWIGEHQSTLRTARGERHSSSVGGPGDRKRVEQTEPSRRTRGACASLTGKPQPQAVPSCRGLSILTAEQWGKPPPAPGTIARA